MGRSGLFVGLVILCFSRLVIPAEIEVTAGVNAQEITMDDLLMYTVSFKGITRPAGLDLSEFEDFKIVQQYRGSSFKMINGQSSYYINFNYYLRPLREGTLKIPSLTYEYQGEVYRTRTFEIRVGPGAEGDPGGRKSSARRQHPFFRDDFFRDDSFFTPRVPEEIDVRLQAEVSSREVWEGEQLLFKVLLISRNRVSSVNLISNPSFQGFWNEEFPTPSMISGSSKTIDNQVYQVFVIKKLALFPTRPGNLTLPSLEFEINLSLGGGSIFDEKKRLVRKTDPNSLRVRDLPPGARGLPVGTFSLQVADPVSSADIREIYTLQATLSGDGNLKTAGIPELADPSRFKVYPAKTTRRNEYRDDRVITRMDIEYPLTFLSPGSADLGALVFEYFDPRRGRKVRLQRSLGTVTVTGEKQTPSDAVSPAGEEIQQSSIRREGEDIAFIQNGGVYDQTAGFYQSRWFVLLLAFPFGINFIMLIKRFVYEPFISRNQVLRNRKILNDTLNRLKSVQSYQEISPVLEKYLSEKLKLGFASLSNLEIDRNLAARRIRDFDINHLIKIKSRSDSARFSPGGENGEKLQQDLELLHNILKRIDRHLK